MFANFLPIAVLGSALLYGYPRSAPWVLGWHYGGSALGVWLFAPPTYQLGASGLAFCTIFFVFTISTICRDRRAIALSMQVFFLYSGMVWERFPTAPDLSYEAHCVGALQGVVLPLLQQRSGPAAEAL